MRTFPWHKKENGAWFFYGIKGWNSYSLSKFPRDFDVLVERPAESPTWNGEGLPPVGTVCELRSPVLLADDEKAEIFPAGTTVEVGGHAMFAGARGKVCTICVVDENHTGTITPTYLSPIRTQEQVEAEARKSAVNEMMADAPGSGSDITLRVCEYLYDAGYRKQATCDPMGYED